MADEDTFFQKPKKLGQGSSLKESLLKGRASITAKPELTEDDIKYLDDEGNETWEIVFGKGE